MEANPSMYAMISRARPLLIAALLVSLALSVWPVDVGQAAATIDVNSTVDRLSNDGKCTLREAIISANKDMRSGSKPRECAAGNGADTINVPAGVYTLNRSDSGKEDSSSTGDLDITSDITLIGAGADVTIIDTSRDTTGFNDRIIHILAGSVTLSKVVIQGGNVASDGGGIYSLGTLTLVNSTLSGNTAGGSGGGLYNAGSLTVVNSTFSGNGAANGGGLYNAAGSAGLTHVTLSSNPAGNLHNAAGAVTLKNTIVANATSGGNCSGSFTSAGHNLSSDLTCATSFNQATDLNDTDARLGSLKNNGGSTLTHALLAGSRAIDGGDDAGCPATDQRGVSRPRGSHCDIGAYETSGNDAWTTAFELTLAGDPPSASVDHFIDKQGQSKWYKFTVQPNSKVIVKLTNLPANYDLTLYKDIAAAFQRLTSQEDLLRLGAEFAQDAFNPDTFSPDTFSPDAFSPDTFSPDTFSPDTFSPDTFSPDTFSPDTFSPDTFSPDTFSPDTFSPDTFSPDTFSPDTFSPDTFSPDTFSPDTFSSAQTRSLIGVSAFEGIAGEGIVVNTWDNTGDFYVRVRGRNGVFSLNAPFHLEVKLVPGDCGSVSAGGFRASNLAASATAGSYKTIILTDLARMTGTSEEKADLQSRLASLKDRPEVNGVVVDVGADARVADANAQADAHPTCPFAKNLVAQAIKDIVDAYWKQNLLEYVVIVGNDDAIPFFRHRDNALLASEKNFVPPVKDNTASQASLKLGNVLSQDKYGARTNISLKTDELPIPELAVGRLVETAADVTVMIDAYLGTNGGEVDQPNSALVTGYDFLEDAARAVEAQLEAGIATQADTLITPRHLSPQDPAAWTADDLRATLLGSRHDLIFLAGHFSANSALAADYKTRLLSTEVEASSVNLTNVIIFSAGCHAGYNIVTEHGVPGVTREPDWAQAFARKGATLIAGTGYQYGDTDFIEYSERLYLEFSRQLRAGTGPVAVGKALVAAKQAYLAGTPQMRGIHEKSFLEATLFGLPMLSVDLPAGRGDSPGDPSIVGATTAFTTNPGATLGLRSAGVTLRPTLGIHTVELTNPADNSTFIATYLSGSLPGSDDVVANPGEPALPREVRNVSAPNLTLRGVGFRGGAYNELLDVLPLLGAPTTEIRGVHAPFRSDVFYPIQPWQVNYFDALAAGSAGATRLVVTPAQLKSSASGSSLAILRSFSEMNFRLYYSNNVTEYANGSVPALSAPPMINRVSAVPGTGTVTFGVNVVGNPAAGIQEVWVTYSATSGPFAGQWQSLDLAQNTADSTLWEATLSLAGTPAGDIRYMVQAVNGVGLITLDMNLGAYYAPAASVAPSQPTTLMLDHPPASGAYGTQAAFSAILKSNSTPLAGQTVNFGLGSQRHQATTDGNGRATVAIPLIGLIGAQEVRASFAGAAQYQASFAAAEFRIISQGTQISLAPQPAVALPGGDPGLTATLADGTGRLLREQAVLFQVTGSGGSYSVPAITDYLGRAALGSVPLPAGQYAVTASYNPSDDRYTPATVTGTLILNRPPDCSTAVPNAATWSPDNKFKPVSVNGVTDPDGDVVTITITGIRQDEPVGRQPDGKIIGPNAAEVRSERDGNGDGRVYHIFFTATDTWGASCTGVVRVTIVPHDQSGNVDAIDQGPLYDSTVPG